MNKTCDGSCSRDGDCFGEIKHVEVVALDGLISWGKFWYCDTAIKKDESEGFRVYVLDK